MKSVKWRIVTEDHIYEPLGKLVAEPIFFDRVQRMASEVDGFCWNISVSTVRRALLRARSIVEVRAMREGR